MTTLKLLAAIRRRPGRALAICVPLLAGSVLTGTAVASTQPGPTLPVTQAQMAATPAPLVQDFATGPTGPRLTPHKHAYRVPEPWNVDGCDHDYGTAGQCVPWRVPAAAGHACAWLRVNGFGPLRVIGRDRQHLDTNHDGVACDRGDKGVRGGS